MPPFDSRFYAADGPSSTVRTLKPTFFFFVVVDFCPFQCTTLSFSLTSCERQVPPVQSPPLFSVL